MKFKAHYTETYNYKLRISYGELVQQAATVFPRQRRLKGFDFSDLYSKTIVRQGATLNSLKIILDMNVGLKVFYYFWMSGNLIGQIFMFREVILNGGLHITSFLPLIFMLFGFLMFTLLSISNALVHKEKFEKFLRKNHLIEKP